MKFQFSLSPLSLKPSLSAAIIFGTSAAVFLVLSFTAGSLLYNFLFSVSFLACVWEVRELLRRQKERSDSPPARKYSEAEYQALGMTRPQKRGYSKSQKMIETILGVAIAALLLYTVTAGTAGAAGRLLGAAMPLLVMLLDYNAVRFTWQEIRHQKFRLTEYALSLLLFLYHLLAALGVVSIQSLLPEQVRFEVNFLLNLAFAPLLLVTIYFSVRDTWRHMYDRPL